MKIYTEYEKVKNGWHSPSRKSPLYPMPEGILEVEEAVRAGFRKVGSQKTTGLTEFVGVKTCYIPGFAGRCERYYVSVWGR